MNVSLHLTMRCNLRCSYCYCGDHPDVSMTPEIVSRTVDFLFDNLGDDTVLAVTFFGGEPLLRFPLIEQTVGEIEARKGILARPELRVRYAINTNGTILTNNLARFIQNHQFHIFLSIDGNARSHDMHRFFPKKQGSFHVVIRNLATFLKINPYLNTLSVVTPDNVNFLAESLLFLGEQGVRFMSVTPDYSARWDKRSFASLTRQYKKIGDYYISQHRKRRKIFINIIDDRIRTHVRRDAVRYLCKIADSEFSIAPDGTIFPCVQFINSDSIQQKHMAVGTVETGWDETARHCIIAESRMEQKECTHCSIRDRCFRFCGCLNYRTTGHVNRVSPFRCAHERMIIPCADKVGEILFKEKNELFLQKFYNPNFSYLSVLEDFLT